MRGHVFNDATMPVPIGCHNPLGKSADQLQLSNRRLDKGYFGGEGFWCDTPHQA